MENNDLNHNFNDIYEEVQAYYRETNKLDTNDYLSDIYDPSNTSDLVEVRFKNTRKGFYHNSLGLDLKKGDIVAVEASIGHDVGIVSLTGFLAKKQFDRKIRKKERYQVMQIYRKVRQSDLERWKKAKEKEISVRNKAREIARNMSLEMKISDADFQGDNTKVIIYYKASGRIDFRELIKHYAKEFQVKIEMRQIGSRQEAAMIGGLCSCGREVCGALWKTEFESVKISAAKIQQLPNNDDKLMGASGKLKSCLNYELDHYIEAWKPFPDQLPVLETAEGNYYPHKTDVLKQSVWYSTSQDCVVNPLEIPLNRILSIARENKKGNRPPLNLEKTFDEPQDTFMIGSSGMFDKPSNKNKKKRKSKSHRRKTNYQPK